VPRSANIRKTVQGEIIRTVFEEAERPLSPREVHELALKKQPTLGIATIYRAIRRFLDEGYVSVVDIPGVGTHYEAAKDAHHHYFYCGNCGRVYVIPGCPGQISALLPPGFRMERHDIVLHGTCRDCTA
jgi:Fur family transcriptional regulator, ferric uptake regulator